MFVLILLPLTILNDVHDNIQKVLDSVAFGLRVCRHQITLGVVHWIVCFYMILKSYPGNLKDFGRIPHTLPILPNTSSFNQRLRNISSTKRFSGLAQSVHSFAAPTCMSSNQNASIHRFCRVSKYDQKPTSQRKCQKELKPSDLLGWARKDVEDDGKWFPWKLEYLFEFPKQNSLQCMFYQGIIININNCPAVVHILKIPDIYY